MATGVRTSIEALGRTCKAGTLLSGIVDTQRPYGNDSRARDSYHPVPMRHSAPFACLALLASAAAAPAAETQRPPQWIVKGEELGCQLSRVPQQPGEAALHIAYSETSPTVRLMVADPALKRDLVRDDGRPATALLEPGGFRAIGKGSRLATWRRGGHGLVVSELEPSFLDAFGKADRVTVEAEGKRISIPYTGGDKALRVLQTCNDELMRVWGLDPAVQAGLQRWPMPKGDGIASLFSYTDYPESAIRADKSGSVVVRIRVSPSGEVVDCAVAISSGTPALDAATCAPIRRRASFEPALNAAGQPVAGSTVTIVHWRLYGTKPAPPKRMTLKPQ